MPPDTVTYCLPFRRFIDRSRRSFEDALRRALADQPGAGFTSTEDPETGLYEYLLRLPGAAGHLAIDDGDEDETAVLMIEPRRGAAQDPRVYEAAAAAVRWLGGFPPGVDPEDADQALRRQRLPTWDAVAACAADEFELDSEEDGWLTLTPDLDTGQQVRASLLEDDAGTAWMVLRTAVMPAAYLPPREALEENALLPFATLALANGEYELCYSYPLEALTRQRLVDLMIWMSDEAATLREGIG